MIHNWLEKVLERLLALVAVSVNLLFRKRVRSFLLISEIFHECLQLRLDDAELRLTIGDCSLERGDLDLRALRLPDDLCAAVALIADVVLCII